LRRGGNPNPHVTLFLVTCGLTQIFADIVLHFYVARIIMYVVCRRVRRIMLVLPCSTRIVIILHIAHCT